MPLQYFYDLEGDAKVDGQIDQSKDIKQMIGKQTKRRVKKTRRPNGESGKGRSMAMDVGFKEFLTKWHSFLFPPYWNDLFIIIFLLQLCLLWELTMAFITFSVLVTSSAILPTNLFPRILQFPEVPGPQFHLYLIIQANNISYNFSRIFKYCLC